MQEMGTLLAPVQLGYGVGGWGGSATAVHATQYIKIMVQTVF